jgi:mycoredoxin
MRTFIRRWERLRVRAVTIDTTVTMYTTQWCAFCRRLKSQLNRDGIEVAEVDIERDEARQLRDKRQRWQHDRPTVVFDGTAMTNPSAPRSRKAARARRELMSGRHDRSLDARAPPYGPCCPQPALDLPRAPQTRKVQASAV